MLQKLFAWVVAGILLCAISAVQAQTFSQEDLSKIKVETLTDAQVLQFIRQMNLSGVNENQIEEAAMSRGMSSSEAAKLKVRIEQLASKDVASPERAGTRSTTVVTPADEASRTVQQVLTSRVFGTELFSKKNLTFEPNLRLATPVDYTIGPDDELLVDIYGHSEASYQLTVSPEGTINIPMAGIISIGGATIEQATIRIRNKLATIYSGIQTGATSVRLSLGNIRSIKVVLTGEIVQPGTYTLPSVATVFNALYASGGPNENGSFRQVQLIRGGTVITTLDIYDFLLYGNMENSIRLQDQDVIRIPVYQTRTDISGFVKRPGIYEMKYGESLTELIRFAGGFKEGAYRARIKLIRQTEREKEVRDIYYEEMEKHQPRNGDEYFVEEILDRFTNRITINGALFRTGNFELESGMTLLQLIEKADGLKEDAFTERGYILRLKPDLTSEVISFNTKDILSGKKSIELKREDVVTIPSIFDLKEEYTLSIDGEVLRPGTFKYAENTSLEDLVLMAGGFREGGLAKRIEVSRRITNSDPRSLAAAVAEVFTVDINRDLREQTAGFILMPFDIVFVRSAPGYEKQRVVRIEGEVLYPGNYTISHKNERISDIIHRAGGLSASAYKEGASLKREYIGSTQLEREKEQYKLQQLQQLQKANADTLDVDFTNLAIRNDFVGIDLPKILSNPGKRADLLVADGDIINIPKLQQTVKVSGEVLAPTSIVFHSGGMRSYINRSGGFSQRAQKRHTYIVYANGSSAGTKKIVFFNVYPSVKPGAEIFVPRKEERVQRLTTTEIVSISTGLATIATLIFTILR